MRKLRIVLKSSFCSLAIAASCFGLTTKAIAQDNIAKGSYYIETDQYTNAGRVFRNLVKAAPTAENLYFLGHYYLVIDKADSALMFFNRSNKTDLNYPLGYVGLGAYNMEKNQRAEAKKNFAQALALSKNKSTEVMYRIAEANVAFANTDAAEAVSLMKTAILLEPKNAKLFIMQADGYLLMNDASNAELLLSTRAQPLTPNNPKIYLRRGRIMERGQNYTEAAKLYNEGLSKDSSYAPLYKELGEVYYLAKRYDAAIANYRKYIAKSDNNPQIRYQFAGFLIDSKNYAEGLQVLKEVAPYIANPFKYRAMAIAQFELGDYKAAAANMDTVFLKADPEKIRAIDYAYYGRMLLKAGEDTTKAVTALQTSLAKDSAEAITVNRELAEMYFRSRKYAEAVPFNEKVANNSKANSKDLTDLGKSYYYAQMYQQADTTFGLAIAKYPTVASNYYWKAMAVGKHRDPKNEKWLTKPYFEAFLAQNPAPETYRAFLIPTYSSLANYYAFHKDKVKSDVYLNKILVLDPNNGYAKQGLAAPVAPSKVTHTKTAAKPSAKPAK